MNITAVSNNVLLSKLRCKDNDKFLSKTTLIQLKEYKDNLARYIYIL